MARGIYSTQWINQQGLNGSSATYTVPIGQVWIVKQLTAYSTPLANSSCHFRSIDSGASLWSAFFTIERSGSQQFYGALVFLEGESFRFEAQDTTPEGGVDVYAGGYALSAGATP